MMPARLHPEELAIEHVRDRRERVPVLGMDVRERPSNTVPIQSGPNMRIFKHVKRIVIIHELMADRLSEHCPGDGDQRSPDREL